MKVESLSNSLLTFKVIPNYAHLQCISLVNSNMVAFLEDLEVWKYEGTISGMMDVIRLQR